MLADDSGRVMGKPEVNCCNQAIALIENLPTRNPVRAMAIYRQPSLRRSTSRWLDQVASMYRTVTPERLSIS